MGFTVAQHLCDTLCFRLDFACTPLMYLVGTVYNFCTYHKSLRVSLHLPGGRRRWLRRTPAIAAGITDHLWTVEELLLFRVPPPRWQLPKRRGRPSHAMKELAAQWCT